MCFHIDSNKSNHTGATCVGETAYPTGTPDVNPVISELRVAGSLVFMWHFVHHCLFFYWLFICLSFDLRVLFAPFVS